MDPNNILQQYSQLTRQSLVLQSQIRLLRPQVIAHLKLHGLETFVVTDVTTDEYALVETEKKKALGKTHLQRLLADWFTTLDNENTDSLAMAELATRYMWDRREAVPVTQLRHVTQVRARNGSRTRSTSEYEQERTRKKALRNSTSNPSTENLI
jgi:hypothetical protein